MIILLFSSSLVYSDGLAFVKIEKKKEAMMELQKQVDASVLKKDECFSQIKHVAKLTKDMAAQRLKWQEKLEKLEHNAEEKVRFAIKCFMQVCRKCHMGDE